MMYYFEYNSDEKYINVTLIDPLLDGFRTTGLLNSRGYFWLPIQNSNNSEIWIDPKIFKNSTDYNSLNCEFLTEFVDNFLPKYQREEKLKRICK